MATSQKKGTTAKRKSGTASKKNRSAKKNTTRKTNSSKKTSTSRTKSAQAKQAQQRAANKQMAAILLFAISLFMLFVAIIPGGSAWAVLHNVFFGLFGVCAFIWPFILMYVAIATSVNNEDSNLKVKVAEASLLVILLCAAVHIFAHPSGVIVNDLKGEISSAWTIAMDGIISPQSGGVFGAFLGGLLLMLFASKVASALTIVLLIFVVIMIMSGTTLVNFFKGLWTPVQKASNATGEQFEEQARLNEERRQTKQAQSVTSSFNPDVPLGPKFDPTEDFFAEETTSNKKTRRRKSTSTTAPTSTATKAAEEAAAAAAAATAATATAATTAGIVSDAKSAEKVKSNQVQEDIIKKAASQKKVSQELTEEETNAEALNKKEVESATKEVEQEISDKSAQSLATYQLPPYFCLKPPQVSMGGSFEGELRENAEKLVQVLESFGVSTSLVGISRGPSVTRYELSPAVGVKISRITNLADDIALNMAASGIRIEAPIPGKAAVGIEIPNRSRETVTLRELLESPEYKKGSSKSLLNVALGRDISGNVCVADLAKMPHLLIAGTTGSGKSVCLNAMILSILYNAKPDEVKLVMIDPKKVEFSVYNGIPHLLIPVVSDPHKASGALGWAVKEMLNRYKTFSENNVRDIKGYNELVAMDADKEKMPHIVIFIDELADLMMATPKEVEDSICRLAQMARAAGMHLVIATQRPSVDVITGLIKANIPSRLSLSVSSAVDSRTILDMGGAEKLLGNGDMLFNPIGSSKPTRIQGCFTSDREVEDVVEYIKTQMTTEYSEEVLKQIEQEAAAAANAKNSSGGVNAPSGSSDNKDDAVINDAIQVVVEAGKASTTLLQRKLSVGYAKAARIIDELEERGIIGPYEGSKPRAVLITKNQWLEMNAMSGDEDDGTAAAIEMGLNNETN